MTHPRFFGYGSLVHLLTHRYPDPAPARVTGWARRWVATGDSAHAVLTAVPFEGGVLDGATARVPRADFVALDAREALYDRLTTQSSEGEVTIYSVPEARQETGPRPPILLSYLDVVAEGYVRLWGEAAWPRFVATTQNWRGSLEDDRHDPAYPRAQVISTRARTLVDETVVHHIQG